MIGIPNFMGIRFSLAPLGPRYLLYMWGVNSQGKLGKSNTTTGSTPVSIGANNWSLVSLSREATLATKKDKSLWSWGNASNGILGTSTSTSRSSPVQVGTNLNWNTVSCGRYHALALTDEKTLFAWGVNTQGQLGQSNITVRSSPVQIGTGTTGDWNNIFTGWYHSFAIKTDNTLWAWGQNTSGQLGLRDSANRSSPVQVGGLTGWKEVSSTSNFTLGVRTDGTLWAWGRNTYGQLGLGDLTNRSSPVQVGTNTDWDSVSVGTPTSLAKKQNGTLWMWGGVYGSLGPGVTANSVSSPIQVGTDNDWILSKIGSGGCFFAVKSNNSLWSWGQENEYGNYLEFRLGKFPLISNYSSPVQTISSSGWKIVNGGFNCAMGIKGATGSTAGGSLWVWGRNKTGLLGVPASIPFVSSPVQLGSAQDWTLVKQKRTDSPAGDAFTFALKENGTLWAWGQNGGGQLGIGNQDIRSSPVQIGSGTTGPWTKEIGIGEKFVIAIQTNGTLWGWGEGTLGQIGNNSTISFSSPVQIGTNTDWSTVNCGEFHTLAVKTDGTLWVWGNNNYGQLGLGVAGYGAAFRRSSPVQLGSESNWKSCFCSITSSFAIKTNGTLWAWGNGQNGRLGLNAYGNRSSPVQVGTSMDWLELSATRESVLAKKTNGTLWAWGRNNYGQLGLNDTTQRSSPTQVGTDTTWYSITTIGGPTNIRWQGCMAVKTDGTMMGWGSRTLGRLGGPSGLFFISPSQVGSLTGWTSLPTQIQGNHSGAIRTIL
jgi:alpha-tubulin suppressor-like RCC1 family protein